MKKNFFSLAFSIPLLFLFWFPKPIFAQGTCNAYREPPVTGSCVVELPHNCQTHYVPVAFERGTHDSCACRCDPDPNNPPSNGDGAGEANLKVNLNTLLSSLPTGILGNWQSLTIGTIVSEVLPYIFVLAGLVLLLMLIFGGFQLMTSAGDPKGMEAGKNRVMYAIIGFLIIFVSFWLVQILQVIFGLPKVF